MDSMRSLNTSLPSSHSTRPVPPEQLLQAFKTAALSVTNLYKTAVTDQSSNRQVGYQDALEDLLGFLDKEELGLQDGEAWRIRQWATERFERSNVGAPNSESDDDRGDTEKRAISPSPSVQPKTNQESTMREQSRSLSPARTASAPPQVQSQVATDAIDRPSMFTFTALPPTPSTEMHMQPSDSPMTNQPPENERQSEASDSTPIRVELVNRGSRTPHRHPGSRHSNRPSNREFNFTTGTKRKLQFPEFFDISNVGFGRDTSGGGGKRGRFV